MIEKEVIAEWKRFLESDEFRHNPEPGTLQIAQHFAEWGRRNPKTKTEKTMERLEIEKKINELICDVLGNKQDVINDDSSLTDDLGADSIDVVELVLGVEKEFGIDIQADVAQKIRTV